MASNFGRRPITDAGKPKPNITYYFNDEERIDRRPLGRVERFVDLQGAVVSLQLAGDGDPNRSGTIDKQRMAYRRKGFIEHAKCPVRHGTYLMAGQIAKDFSAMPESLKANQCETDPRTLVKKGHDLHATEACPHVEWLIAARVKKEAEQNKKRNAKRVADEKRAAEALELQTAQLEMVKEQIEERKRTRKNKASAE